MPYFVYLLECRGKSYYCGLTKNVSARVLAHNNGTGGRYTRSHRPVKLVFFEKAKTLKTAMKREREIKTFSRKKKKELVEQKKARKKKLARFV